jgi:hypothetical protein
LDGVKKKVIAIAVPIGSIFFPIDQSSCHLNVNLKTPSKTEQNNQGHEVPQKVVLYHIEVCLKHHNMVINIL